MFRQLREAELGGDPKTDLLAEARQVHEQPGARVEVVENEVAVGDCVDRVSHRRLGKWQAERRSGHGACTERRRLGLAVREREPCRVPFEHLDPRQEVMPHGDGDRAL